MHGNRERIDKCKREIYDNYINKILNLIDKCKKKIVNKV